MKIVIDCYGADYSPDELVKGAITAVNLIDDVEIILTGKQDEIQKVIDEYGYKGDKLSIVDAPEVISCDESPTMAIRRKTGSSLVAGLNLLKENDDIVGMISAGSTGAVLAGGLFTIGRMEGVKRPALAPLMPTLVDGKKALLIDCGANVDCKPEYLQQFAIMGSVYVKAMRGVENPKVALLSNGVEDHKGNDLVHQAFALLKETKDINFVGNIEAREMLSGEYDVIVCDGFVGNVALKATEGTFKVFTTVLKNEIKAAGLGSKIGALMMKKVFKNIKRKLSYTDVGGSPFLGINKILVKSHGSSKADTIFSCVKQVIEIHNSNYINEMREGIKNSSMVGEN